MMHNEENNRKLTITRIFDAPRERLWQSWTNADMLSCWHGPNDFTAPYTQIDLRIGGKYLNCMRGPDGKDYWSTGIYTEINEPTHIRCTDSFADEHGNIVPASFYGVGDDIPIELLVDVSFEDIGRKTRMTLTHCCFPNAEIRDMTAAGWSESFDKLAECLR